MQIIGQILHFKEKLVFFVDDAKISSQSANSGIQPLLHLQKGFHGDSRGSHARLTREQVDNHTHLQLERVETKREVSLVFQSEPQEEQKPCSQQPSHLELCRSGWTTGCLFGSRCPAHNHFSARNRVEVCWYEVKS